jgi:hypothetical protein
LRKLLLQDADNKKPVRMLSTFHSAQELPSGRPKIVNNYNKNVSGVNTTDATINFTRDFTGLSLVFFW